FRWLNETWLKVDRGVSFYNASPIPLDLGFLASRLALAALGLGAVAVSSRHFAAGLRGAKPGRRAARRRVELGADAATAPVDVRSPAMIPLAMLGMTHRRPGRLSGIWHVARVELAELRSSPGLYLFIPLLLLLTISVALVETGFLDTSFLITPTR